MKSRHARKKGDISERGFNVCTYNGVGCQDIRVIGVWVGLFTYIRRIDIL